MTLTKARVLYHLRVSQQVGPAPSQSRIRRQEGLGEMAGGCPSPGANENPTDRGAFSILQEEIQVRPE